MAFIFICWRLSHLHSLTFTELDRLVVLHAIAIYCLCCCRQYVVGVDMIYAKLKQLEIASFAAKYAFNRLLIALILLLLLLLN